MAKPGEDDSVEQSRSTLHAPASPMSAVRLVRRLEGVVKRCETLTARGTVGAPVAPGTKNSTSCESPSVTGDHHATERSGISPTRTGPHRGDEASLPRNTICVSRGSPARSRATRSDPAWGEASVSCAANPPATGNQCAAASARGKSRLRPIATRLSCVRRFSPRTFSISAAGIAARRTWLPLPGARRRMAACRMSLGATAASPGTTGRARAWAASAQVVAAAARRSRARRLEFVAGRRTMC